MGICEYVTWFGAFSFLGWVYECTYCTINTKRWQNRGFLFGPVCPIYGFGVALVLLLADAVPAPTAGGDGSLAWWQVFLGASLASAVLEYVTSYVMERLFHARWWDYSNVPLNLNGRTCLPFALCFGAVGTVLYYYVCPLVTAAGPGLPTWAWEVLALLVTCTMSVDLGFTVSTLTNVTRRIEASRSDFDAVMETAVSDIASGRRPLEEDAQEAFRHAASEMSRAQRNVLQRVRTFSTERREESARLLRRALDELEGDREPGEDDEGRDAGRRDGHPDD